MQVSVMKTVRNHGPGQGLIEGLKRQPGSRPTNCSCVTLLHFSWCTGAQAATTDPLDTGGTLVRKLSVGPI